MSVSEMSTPEMVSHTCTSVAHILRVKLYKSQTRFTNINDHTVQQTKHLKNTHLISIFVTVANVSQSCRYAYAYTFLDND